MMVDITDTIETVTSIVGKLALLGEKSLPYARIFFDIVPVPYGSAVVDALTTATPYLDKIAQGVPILMQAEEQGRPVFEAIQENAPQIVSTLKILFATAVNNDPARPETNMSSADVSDGDLLPFLGGMAKSAKTIMENSYFTPQDQRFNRDPWI